MFAPSGPAVAFSSGGLFLDVQVEEPVRLVARGAAVDVPLDITCNASEPVQVFVTVTQRVNRGIAAGSGFASFGCTGSGQDVTVRVTAGPSGKAFVRDKAAAPCLDTLNPQDRWSVCLGSCRSGRSVGWRCRPTG